MDDVTQKVSAQAKKHQKDLNKVSEKLDQIQNDSKPKKRKAEKISPEIEEEVVSEEESARKKKGKDKKKVSKSGKNAQSTKR